MLGSGIKMLGSGIKMLGIGSKMLVLGADQIKKPQNAHKKVPPRSTTAN
jgi:hypothetical protein